MDSLGEDEQKSFRYEVFLACFFLLYTKSTLISNPSYYEQRLCLAGLKLCSEPVRTAGELR